MHDDQHDFDDFLREPDFSSRRRRDMDLRNAPSWAQAFAWLGVLFGLIHRTGLVFVALGSAR